MKNLKIKVLALGLGAVLLAPQAYAEHSWGTYHWARVANPAVIKVIDSTTAVWDVQRIETLADWAVSDALDFSEGAADDSSKTRKRCPSVAGQIRVCNSNYGQNGWLGLATIGINAQGHIDRGTAKLNDSYDWYWTPEEMNHVMCQEVGHLFGLGHTSEDGTSQQTCMDYSSDPASQWPNAHDYELLASKYAHLDSYNSYDDGASGGSGGGTCNAPKGKGCNSAGMGEVPPMGVRVHGSGHEEIWVAARADGGLWIHHIRLAPSH